MNYLIKLLKSCFAVVVTVKATWRAFDLACRSEEGVFYAFPGGCQPLCLAGEASDKKCAKLLTNQGFYTLYTAGNAWRPRQRMRTLRFRGRVGKRFIKMSRKKFQLLGFALRITANTGPEAT